MRAEHAVSVASLEHRALQKSHQTPRHPTFDPMTEFGLAQVSEVTH
jgi:hypothetical protein